MARGDDVVWWPTVEEALSRLTVRDLQTRARAIATKVPSRKPQLVAMLAEQLKGERLHALWERLGGLERAAIAEVVLPTLEVVATDESLGAADRMVLERYAGQASDRVWQITAEHLLGALESGGSLDELAELLAARSAEPLPEPVRARLPPRPARARLPGPRPVGAA